MFFHFLKIIFDINISIQFKTLKKIINFKQKQIQIFEKQDVKKPVYIIGNPRETIAYNHAI
jgi:hypothetical protein